MSEQAQDAPSGSTWQMVGFAAVLGAFVWGLVALFGGSMKSEPPRAQVTAPSTAARPVIDQTAYAKLLTGMTYSEVTALVGSAGSQLSESSVGASKAVVYGWTNADGSNAVLQFQGEYFRSLNDLTLVTKAQAGLN